MAHVLELCGCTAQGATAESAIAGTPQATRAFLRFLARHGEPAEPDAQFQIKTAEHVVRPGRFVGSGSPLVTFRPDLRPISLHEIETLLRQLDCLTTDLLEMVGRLTPRRLTTRPDENTRSVREVLEHLVEAERFYLRSTLGTDAAPQAPVASIRSRENDVIAWMKRVRQLSNDRIRALTPAQRRRVVRVTSLRWFSATWTVRKMLRRMLEHEWEHFVKLAARLGRAL
jgi:uncharacterized damage-inducible protein DinB/predicted RNase H-like HicB family nuclease